MSPVPAPVPAPEPEPEPKCCHPTIATKKKKGRRKQEAMGMLDVQILVG